MEHLALQCASGHGSAEVLRRLLDTSEALLNCTTAAGNSLLHCAALSGDVDLINLLLSRRPSLAFCVNAAGATACDVACDARCRQALALAAGYTSAAAMIPEGQPQIVELEDGGATAPPLPIGFGTLPEEIQMLIFCHLDQSLPTLLALRQCNQRLRKLADSDPIWERLCWVHYKVLRTSCLAGSWRSVFIEHTILQAGRKQAQAQAREQRYLEKRSALGLDRCEPYCNRMV